MNKPRTYFPSLYDSEDELQQLQQQYARLGVVGLQEALDACNQVDCHSSSMEKEFLTFMINFRKLEAEVGKDDLYSGSAQHLTYVQSLLKTKMTLKVLRQKNLFVAA